MNLFKKGKKGGALRVLMVKGALNGTTITTPLVCCEIVIEVINKI